MEGTNTYRMTEEKPITSDPVPAIIRTSLGKIAYTDEGPKNGPVLICLHGIPGSTRDFRYLSPLLFDIFRVIRVDMPGFGNSPHGQVSSVDDWSRVPSALADALGINRYIMLSHSFSSSSVMQAGSRDHLRVDGIVLIASVGPRVHRGFGVNPLVFRFFAALVAFPLSRPFAFEAGRKHYAKIKLPIPETWKELLLQLRILSTMNFSNVRKWVSKIKARTLYFYAADDRLIEVEIGRELAEILPNSESVEFEEGGHHIQKTRAQQIAQKIKETFLSSSAESNDRVSAHGT